MAGEGGAAILMAIDWTFNGKANHKDLALAVRINKGMGADAIIGKATRKAAAWLFQTVTGQTVDEGEANESAPVTEVKASVIEEPPATKLTVAETGDLPM